MYNQISEAYRHSTCTAKTIKANHTETATVKGERWFRNPDGTWDRHVDGYYVETLDNLR